MHACFCIEADGVAAAAAPRRIVGENEREAFFRVRFAAQPRPVQREVRDEVDARAFRRMPRLAEFRRKTQRRFLLEGNRAREDAPVDFRQDDIHSEIGAVRPAR